MPQLEGGPDARVLVLTADRDLGDMALAAAASVDVPAVCERDTALLLRTWRAVVVGLDYAAAAARHGPPEAGVVHLVGREGDQDALCGWSATLGAAITVLPDGVRGLSAALVGATGARGTVLGVVGGSGGVGATTLASALADLGARRGLRSLLVDLDPWGGGIDVAVGLEAEPGWRWSGFAAARGFIGDVRDHVPAVGGVAVLAWDRSADAEEPGPIAVASVIRSGVRTHDLVVVDLGRRGEALAEQVALCDGTIVVARGSLSGLAAADRLVARGGAGAPLALVARPGGVRPEELADALGVPLLGSLPDDGRVAAASARGDGLATATGRGYKRALIEIAARVLPGAS